MWCWRWNEQIDDSIERVHDSSETLPSTLPVRFAFSLHVAVCPSCALRQTGAGQRWIELIIEAGFTENSKAWADGLYMRIAEPLSGRNGQEQRVQKLRPAMPPMRT